MFLLFLITLHLNARIPEKLVFWTVSYTPAQRPSNITPPSQSQIPLNETTCLIPWGPVFEPLVNTLN